MKHLTRKEVRALKVLIEQHITIANLRKIFGISQYEIYKHIKKKKETQYLNNKEKEFISNLVKEDKSFEEIKRSFKHTFHYIKLDKAFIKYINSIKN